MLSIVLFGNRKDRQLALLLRGFLAREFTVHHFTETRFDTWGSGPALNLTETDSMRELALKKSILIVKQHARPELLTEIDRETPIIIDAANVRGLARLNPERTNVYTCGYSPKDAITFSSRGTQGAVVSLQRAVHGESGWTCEPFELSCELEGEADDYSVLASVMTLILMRRLGENSSRGLGKIYFSYSGTDGRYYDCKHKIE